MIVKIIVVTMKIEVIRTTDLMVTLREKGRRKYPRKLLLRESAYETVKTHTLLPTQEINRVNMEMKRLRMVRITNTLRENDGFKQNPDYS